MTTTYVLKIGDELGDSTRWSMSGQLQEAVDRLTGIDETNRAKAVHGARKNLKKSRSLLRLVRTAMPEGVYRREMDVLRNSARTLSAVRDADALIVAVEKLDGRYVGRVPAATFQRLQERLAIRDLNTGVPDPGDAIADALRLLSEVISRLGLWPLGDLELHVPLAGISRSYARGYDAFSRVREHRRPELLHEWRKRVKDLWYQQRLLNEAWPAVFDAQAETAHELSELLGDDHDLTVLAQALNQGALGSELAGDLATVMDLIGHRKRELQAQALLAGRRLYAERPKAFSKRIKRIVDAAWREAVSSLEPATDNDAGPVSRGEGHVPPSDPLRTW